MDETINDPTGDSTAQAPADTSSSPEGTDALGDAGKRALDAMKAERNAAKARAKELEAELAKLTATPEAPTVDVDAIRNEVLSAANKRVLRSEIKAAATGKLTDPADALVYLKLDGFKVNDDGDFDAAEISAAISSLVESKPYLAAKAFQGTGDGGAQRKASGPTQLTREDLKGMKPEAISKAKAEGRLKDVLGHK